MRIFYDTEFLERGPDFPVMLISIGMVRDDGDEYYAVSADIDERLITAHPWMTEHVWPYLPQTLDGRRLHRGHKDVKPRWRIAAEVKAFVLAAHPPELWAWNGSYDHVVYSQLFGTMTTLPDTMPRCTYELKQRARDLGVDDSDLPEQPTAEHHALADARWDRDVAHHLDRLGS